MKLESEGRRRAETESAARTDLRRRPFQIPPIRLDKATGESLENRMGVGAVRRGGTTALRRDGPRKGDVSPQTTPEQEYPLGDSNP